MLGPVHHGLLPVRIDTLEWILSSDKRSLVLPDGYVVSFTYFHERGLASPAHRFLLGLLDQYRIELQHLDPNRIQHITIFIVLCEGFLGIMPCWDLWRYFFTAELRKERMLNQTEAPLPMGCVSIHLRGGGRAREYIPMRLSVPNRGVALPMALPEEHRLPCSAGARPFRVL
jgi:hypothetical protein